MNNSKWKLKIGMLIGMPILFVLILILFSKETDEVAYKKFLGSERVEKIEAYRESLFSDKESLNGRIKELNESIALLELADLLTLEHSTSFIELENILEHYLQNLLLYRSALESLVNKYEGSKNVLIINQMLVYEDEIRKESTYYEESEKYLAVYQNFYLKTGLVYEQFKRLQLAVIKLPITEASLRNKILETTSDVAFAPIEDTDLLLKLINELNSLKAEYSDENALAVINELEDFYRSYFAAIEIYKNFIEDL